jgi:hypothetical protein
MKKRPLDQVGGTISVAVEPGNVDYTRCRCIPGFKGDRWRSPIESPFPRPGHLHPSFARLPLPQRLYAPLGQKDCNSAFRTIVSCVFDAACCSKDYRAALPRGSNAVI